MQVKMGRALLGWVVIAGGCGGSTSTTQPAAVEPAAATESAGSTEGAAPTLAGEADHVIDAVELDVEKLRPPLLGAFDGKLVVMNQLGEIPEPVILELGGLDQAEGGAAEAKRIVVRNLRSLLRVAVPAGMEVYCPGIEWVTEPLTDLTGGRHYYVVSLGKASVALEQVGGDVSRAYPEKGKPAGKLVEARRVEDLDSEASADPSAGPTQLRAVAEIELTLTLHAERGTMAMTYVGVSFAGPPDLSELDKMLEHAIENALLDTASGLTSMAKPSPA